MIITYDKAGAKDLNTYIHNLKPYKIFVLTDDNTRQYCLPGFKNSFHHEFTNVNTSVGDHHKNLETLHNIWQELLDAGADRSSILINLGGGVITDIGGFAAATFKRGIKFIHVPTTLLGMVDAAIGGKNGINFGTGKNQIGTIVLPDIIWINSMFLDTLPKNEFDSGFAEMLKHGLIQDAGYWYELIAYYQNKRAGNLSALIKKSVEIKSEIIEQDPQEHGIRKLLNFGHTIGHAIESYFNYEIKKPVTHGKAVAIGMLMEAYLSYKLNMLDFQFVTEIKQVINDIYTPISLNNKDIEQILQWLKYDKKNQQGKVLYVLLHSIGKAGYNYEVPLSYLYEAFDFYAK